MPLLRSIALELTNTCDRRCPYCYGRQQTRPEGFMSVHLVNQILAEINGAYFPRRIALNFNGESLRHPEFPAIWAATLRTGKHVRINTNRFSLLLAKTQQDFDWTLSLHDASCPQGPIYSWDMHRGQLKTNSIIPRNLHLPTRTPSKQCDWPSTYMAILWNGDVTLCCHDLEGRNVIGNVNQGGVFDMWSSREYNKARSQARVYGTPQRPACQACNLY